MLPKCASKTCFQNVLPKRASKMCFQNVLPKCAHPASAIARGNPIDPAGGGVRNVSLRSIRHPPLPGAIDSNTKTNSNAFECVFTTSDGHTIGETNAFECVFTTSDGHTIGETNAFECMFTTSDGHTIGETNAFECGRVPKVLSKCFQAESGCLSNVGGSQKCFQNSSGLNRGCAFKSWS